MTVSLTTATKAAVVLAFALISVGGAIKEAAQYRTAGSGPCPS